MISKIFIKKLIKAKLIKDPVDHLIIDNFLPKKIAKKLSLEFGDYNSAHWHEYKNSIEEKKNLQYLEFILKKYLYIF